MNPSIPAASALSTVRATDHLQSLTLDLNINGIGAAGRESVETLKAAIARRGGKAEVKI